MPTLVDTLTPTRLFRQGRQPGTRNVHSKTVKHNVMQVFEGLGGWEAMLHWAKENQTAFYTVVYPKLLPAELAESGHGSGITVIVQRSQAPGAIPTTETLEHKPLETDPRPLQAGQAVE